MRVALRWLSEELFYWRVRWAVWRMNATGREQRLRQGEWDIFILPSTSFTEADAEFCGCTNDREHLDHTYVDHP